MFLGHKFKGKSLLELRNVKTINTSCDEVVATTKCGFETRGRSSNSKKQRTLVNKHAPSKLSKIKQILAANQFTQSLKAKADVLKDKTLRGKMLGMENRRVNPFYLPQINSKICNCAYPLVLYKQSKTFCYAFVIISYMDYLLYHI